MNEHLKLDEQGEALIKGFEKCSLKAYICPAGKLTIGWGHTNDHGRQFASDAVWTQEDADAAFREDMFGFECHVRALVTVPLNQGEMSALVSFAYNCGWQALRKSTLLAKLNRGDRKGAAREFLKWTHGGPDHREFPGLVRRRRAEEAMFSGVPEHTVTFGNYEMPQHVSPPKVPPAPSGPAVTAGTFAATSITAISDKLKTLDLHMLADPVVIICGAALVAVTVIYWWHWRAHIEAHA
jgi:lysozyme